MQNDLRHFIILLCLLLYSSNRSTASYIPDFFVVTCYEYYFGFICSSRAGPSSDYVGCDKLCTVL